MFLLNANTDQGLVIMIVGMLIVFTALLSLYLVFSYLLPAIIKLIEGGAKKPKAAPLNGENPKDIEGEMTGETAAAIALALNQFLGEVHDEENTVLTIHQAPKNYSPWSSKFYSTYSRTLHRSSRTYRNGR